MDRLSRMVAVAGCDGDMAVKIDGGWRVCESGG